MSLARVIGRCALAVVTVAGAIGVGTAASGTAPAQPAQSPQCAWRFMSNGSALNVAFPDTNATYWVLPYALGPGGRIELSGSYPQARYFSLNTYGTRLDTVDTLRDAQITPDPGSVNPFATAEAGAGGTWHATVVAGPADHSRNQLAALPTGDAAQAGPVGFLILRVYVPDDTASPTGGVPLPDVKLVYANGAATVPVQTCPGTFDPTSLASGPVGAAAKEAINAALARAASGAFRPGTPEATFVAPASTAGLFPNGDNRYLGAGLTYQPGRIAVIRGKAPSFPDTRAGESPDSPGTEVRYWSMCQNDQVAPFPVVACAADYQTALDEDGYYTYVIATPEDLPANAGTDPDVTVLPWGSTQPRKIVLLRNMLPAEDFPNSVQAAQGSTAPQAIMGDYYPQTTYCAKSTFESGGAAACFGG